MPASLAGVTARVTVALVSSTRSSAVQGPAWWISEVADSASLLGTAWAWVWPVPPAVAGWMQSARGQAEQQVVQLTGWKLARGDERIQKQWVMKDFVSAMTFFQHVAELAEQEGHHPDLHLENYRNVTIEIRTHAIGGLSENDFILAAKIDALPAKLKTA